MIKGHTKSYIVILFDNSISVQTLLTFYNLDLLTDFDVILDETSLYDG